MISERFVNINCDLRGLEPRERLSSGLPFLECWNRTFVSSTRVEFSSDCFVERSNYDDKEGDDEAG